jgi:hypothetical protein
MFLTLEVAVRHALGAPLRQLDVRNIYDNPVHYAGVYVTRNSFL